MGDGRAGRTRLTIGRVDRAAAWPLEALHAAIARAGEVGADEALAGRSVEEIRRALVLVQRVCRDAERAADQALALLARDDGSRPQVPR